MLDTTAPSLDYRYDDETLPVVERRAERRLKRLGARVDAAGRARRKRGCGRGQRKDARVDRRERRAGACHGLDRRRGPARPVIDTSSPWQSRARARAAARPRAEPARVFLKLEGIRGTSDAANLPRLHRSSAKRRPGRLSRSAGWNRVSLRRLGGQRSEWPHRRAAASTRSWKSRRSSMRFTCRATISIGSTCGSFPPPRRCAGANFSIGRLSVFKLGE